MNANGSAVVETLEAASLGAWKKWRNHVLAGTAETPEALVAFEESNFASATLAIERAARLELGAAVPSHCSDRRCPGLIDAEGCCDCCGVDHSAPCPACQQRGFHAEGCAEAEQ